MRSIILFFLIFFFQSIANANLLSDCQNIIQKPLNELAELCPIGNNKTESLQDFITTIEQAIGKEAIKEMYPMQHGDVPRTFADVDELIKDYKYSPSTDIKSGTQSFVKWFINYKKK